MFNRPLMGIEDNPLTNGLFNNDYTDGGFGPAPPPPPGGDYLLLTNNDYFLLTTGDYLELPS